MDFKSDLKIPNATSLIASINPYRSREDPLSMIDIIGASTFSSYHQKLVVI